MFIRKVLLKCLDNTHGKDKYIFWITKKINLKEDSSRHFIIYVISSFSRIHKNYNNLLTIQCQENEKEAINVS